MKKVIVTGIIMTISGSPLFRGLFFNLEASIFLTILASLSALYFLAKLRENEPFNLSKPLSAAGLAIIAAYFLSFLTAVNVRENIAAVLRNAVYFLVFCVLYDYWHERKERLNGFVMLPVVISGLYSAIIGLEALTGAFPFLNDTLFDGRVGSVFQYCNTASMYFGVCLVFTLSLLDASDKTAVRLMLAGAGNIILLAFLLTGSRGGYITGVISVLAFLVLLPAGTRFKSVSNLACMAFPAVVFMKRVSTLSGSHGFLAMTGQVALSCLASVAALILLNSISRAFFKTKRRRIAIITLLSIAAASVLGLIVLWDSIVPKNIIERWYGFGWNNPGVTFRIEFDGDALKLISRNLFTGLGGGGWASLYQSVQEQFYTARAVHNNYLQVFTESGIIGFAAYMFIMVFSGFIGAKSLTKEKNPAVRRYHSGFFSAFLALALHSSFDFDLSYVSISLLFWLLAARFAACIPEKGGEKSSLQIKACRKPLLICFAIVCSVLVSWNGVYSLACFYAKKGTEGIESGRYIDARSNYEKAARIDGINPQYAFQLSKLYDYFSRESPNAGYAAEWREMAVRQSEKSVLLNPFYPAYSELLTRLYFDSGKPIQALERAKALVSYQPCNDGNYELLGRGYLEVADYYFLSGNTGRALELWEQCSQISQYPHFGHVTAYEEKARDLLEINR